jgi:hypothetical protein
VLESDGAKVMDVLKRSTSMSLSCCLAVLLSCCLGLLKDPLQDSRFSTVKASSSFSDPTDDVACSIGDVYSSNTYRFEIALQNESGNIFEATDIRASCGCVAGITSQMLIPNRDEGVLVVVMSIPEALGEFEKTVYVKNVVGQELTIRVRGRSVPRILISHGNLVVSEFVKQTDGIYLEAESTCEEELNDMVWSAESSVPIEMTCRSMDTESGKSRLDFKCDIDSSIKDSSIMVYLTCSSSNGLVLMKKEFQLLLGYNATTTPRRLILKDFGGVYKGVLVIRKAKFLDDDVNQAMKTVELQLGDDFEKRIEIDASVQRLRNGSFILKFEIEREQTVVAGSSKVDNADSRLVLDLQNRDFFVPVVLQ